MQKWGIKGIDLTLVDLLQEDHSSTFLGSKPAQKLQEQPFGTSATKVWCNTMCLSAKLRTKNPLYTHKSKGEV